MCKDQALLLKGVLDLNCAVLFKLGSPGKEELEGYGRYSSRGSV